MTKLKNNYGDIFYMTEEKKGIACGKKYTQIYLYSEDLGKDYGTNYTNAIDDTQPNIWVPYELTDNQLTIYNDSSKNISYHFEIIK